MSTSSAPTSAERPFARVSIVGLGVMGGSLARALHALADAPEVFGWGPDADERTAASASGVFTDVPATRAHAMAEAELVVLAAPPSASLDSMEAVAVEAPMTATITDVTSLKVPMAEAADRVGLLDRWVGSHPMAGSHASGFGASRADLYVGATVWTVADELATERAGTVHRFWEALGAHPKAIRGDQHDRLMALVSHLPQLASTALAGVLADHGIDPVRMGPGGRDATRLAASSPEMWADLLALAPPESSDALRALSDECARLADLIESHESEEIVRSLRRSKEWRADL